MNKKKYYINLYSGCYLTNDEFNHIMRHSSNYKLRYNEKQNGYTVLSLDNN